MVFPLLHANSNDSLYFGWNLDPLPIAGLLAAGIVYFLSLRQMDLLGRKLPSGWQIAAYYSGLGAVAIALLGPLDTYNDELFFVHMLQHLALMQIAAPLILLGRPLQLILRAVSPKRSGPIVKAVIRPRVVRAALTALTAPLIATLLFNGNLIFWHIPEFYQAALRSGVVHEIEHLAFLGFALLFWWPIIDPIPRHHKTRPIWAITTVFVSMVFGIGLGAILTLADSAIYPFYLDTPKPWDLTARTDQQLAGLSMWVGGGLIYFGILIGMLVRLVGTGDEPAPSPGPPTPVTVR